MLAYGNTGANNNATRIGLALNDVALTSSRVQALAASSRSISDLVRTSDADAARLST